MPRSPSSIAVAILALLCVPSLMVRSADAQLGSYSPVERYNRVAKGKNVSEWHRRIFDDDANVRLDAVESLGKDGSEEAVKPLLDATVDPDPRVRAKAFDYLGMIGSHRATVPLSQYLFLNDVDQASKERILVALGRINDPAAVGPLLDFVAKTENEKLRCGALYALGEIGDPKALALVTRYRDSSDDPHVKRIADDAASKINARVAALPNEQPTLIELERRLRPPDQR